MEPRWLSADEREAWLGLVAVMELLPGVLDTQLRRDADLTQFDYYVLAILSETQARTLRMTELAAMTNSTLPRLSHVVRRLADRNLVDKRPCPTDGRATNVTLTDAGWAKVRDAAPGHVDSVRKHVIDPLTASQVAQLTELTHAMLERLDPEGTTGPVEKRRAR